MKEMTLSEIKACSIEMLKFIDNFCVENNICYSLCAGTALGAVRHKGFIPWDDDIDIMLNRKDYEKMFLKFPSSGRYRFLSSENTNNFPYAYGKIIDTSTVKIEHISKKYQQIGVDIDVFPIDNFPSSIEDSLRLCSEIESIDRIISRYLVDYTKSGSVLKKLTHNSKVLFWHIIDRIGLFSMRKYINKMQSISQSFNNTETGYRGIICIAHYGINERNEKSLYDDSIRVEFEGGFYPIPKKYKQYLENLYGSNYMQIPPEEKRKTHHAYKAYWK